MMIWMQLTCPAAQGLQMLMAAAVSRSAESMEDRPNPEEGGKESDLTNLMPITCDRSVSHALPTLPQLRQFLSADAHQSGDQQAKACSTQPHARIHQCVLLNDPTKAPHGPYYFHGGTPKIFDCKMKKNGQKSPFF